MSRSLHLSPTPPLPLPHSRVFPLCNSSKMSSAKSVPLSKFNAFKEKFLGNSMLLSGFWKTLVISGLFILVLFFFSYKDPTCSASRFFSISSFGTPSNSPPSSLDSSPTNLSHIAFGLQGSEKTCHHRKHYMESWWRPNITRGYVYLDGPPTGDLLPWSPKSPPYRVNDDLSQLIQEIRPRNPLMPRMVHGILELFREEHEGLRWLIMGDDDTMFFVDNLVDVLSKYDHTKYYYIGYQSEFVLSNLWYSFRQSFGGGGIILSYPLVKALIKDMDRCLREYSNLSADLMTMACLEDLGASLTHHKGVHQVDLRGDLSGFLSAHPKELVLSLHHIDTVDPYFPKMDRAQSTHHLMKAGNMDQSRLFQQTICYHRKKNWSFSIAWGYSAQIYEKILHRSTLQTPIETFRSWTGNPNPPRFMFNTRSPNGDPCEAPHMFFLESIEKNVFRNEILTVYNRSAPRGLPACAATGNHSAEYVSSIHVISPAKKRAEIQRAECCDVVRLDDAGKAEVKFRECGTDEVIG